MSEGRTSDIAPPGTPQTLSRRGSTSENGFAVSADADAETLRAELAAARSALHRERQRRVAAETQVENLRRESARAQVAVETEEEAIANRLMKRLSALKLEKEQIARASESDSEWVANSLSARLDELKRQKDEVIRAAEAENEFIVNRLNKELEALRLEKIELERRIDHLSHSTTPAGGTPGSSPARSFSSGGFSRTGSYRIPGAGNAIDSDDRDRITPMPNSPYSGAPVSSNAFPGGRTPTPQ